MGRAVTKARMMTFRFGGKKYAGASALDVVNALKRDSADYPHAGESIRKFLLWSLENLRERIPPRDLDLSSRLENEELALSYLYLRDEYGAGTLSIGKSKREGSGI